jgi:hypothetical protein
VRLFVAAGTCVNFMASHRLAMDYCGFQASYHSIITITYFCLQPSELNDILNFAKRTIFSEFVIVKTWARITFGLIRYLYVGHRNYNADQTRRGFYVEHKNVPFRTLLR